MGKNNNENINQPSLFDFMNLDGDGFLAKPIQEPAQPKVTKQQAKIDDGFRNMKKQIIKDSLQTNSDGKKAGYIGIMPAYSTASYQPITVSQEVSKAPIVKAYLTDGSQAIMKNLSDPEKKATVEIIRRFNLTKNNVIIADFCNGLYKYITDRNNDAKIERLLNEQTKQVEYLKTVLPYSTVRKLTYGEALVNEQGQFKHGAGTILNKHVEPALIDMITHKTGTPTLLTFKKGSNEPSLYFKSPILFNSIDQHGNIEILADPSFFLIKEEAPGGYIASDRYIPTLLGEYSLIVLGHALELQGTNGKGRTAKPSPTTAYRYLTALNCAFNGQSIMGIQAEVDRSLTVNRTNIRLNRQVLAQLFKVETQWKPDRNGILQPYTPYRTAIEYTDACGAYLWHALEYMGALPELRQQTDADRIILPAKEHSAQFNNEITKTGFFVKCDNILHAR